MRKFYILFCIATLVYACDKIDKSPPVKKGTKEVLAAGRERKDRLSMDTLYTRSWMNIKYQDGTREEVEIYVTTNNDTIINQYKYYDSNDILDTIASTYYEFSFEESGKPYTYVGSITLHSKYKNLNLNKNNRRTLEFSFCEQNADSMSLKYLKSEKSNTINFESKNYYNKKLIGLLYQLTERDTTNEMVNLNQIHILVDNTSSTNNLFLKAYDIDKDKYKKFNPTKLKLTKD